MNDKLYKVGEFDESNTKLAEQEWQYDAVDRPTKLTYTSSGCNVEENITYTTAENSAAPTNRVKNYTYAVENKDEVSIENTYDKFHRVTAKAVTVGVNDISKEYIYEYTRLSRVLHSIGETQIHNYMLGYDLLSRITSETDSKVSDYGNTYVYDAYGQLVRENNKRLNKTILYTYDNIGNIIRVQGYDYTTDEEVSGTPVENVFVYSESMPDKLTSFNGKNITYDANGRVSTYDGWEYTWERAKLKSIEQTNSTDEMPPKYTFTYNAYGERASKVYTHVKLLADQSNYLTNSTTTYKYDLCGRLIRETRSLQYSNTASVTKELTYLYEGSEIIGLVYTTADGASTYYYDKNVYGDVISILDNAGNTVVKYKYDAYGNCEYYDSVNADLAETNPIRYRGYYYDTDTGLYYLQARYYNPEWRRFISQDSTSYLDPENPNGLNLYCYCGNDPVNYVDPSGHSWESFWNGVGDWFSDNWAKLAIGAGAIALGVLTMGVATLISGAGMAAALSAMGTAVASSLVQVGISTAISAGIGFAVGSITSGSWEGAVDGMLNGIADGFMWGGIFAGAGQMLNGAMKITRTLAPKFNGAQLGRVKLWSPNNAGNQNVGGTLIKFGKFNRIDSEIGKMIHIHLKLFGLTFDHLPIGMIASGVIGGF